MRKLLKKWLLPLATSLGVLGVIVLLGTSHLAAQVPGGLFRFGTTGVFNPQVGNCLSIMAMNSSGQTATDSGVPCGSSVLLTDYTNATTAYTSVMALPTVQGAVTVTGECALVWESSNTSGTVTFAAKLSAAPTDLWVTANASSGAYVAPTYTIITSNSQTDVTGALAPTGATTPYTVTFRFTLANAAAANTLTVYAKSNNTSYTASVLAGSSCKWVP